ncbi:MAG: histidinol-phosphate aminotransferase family protein [Alphaproteobacteria bacterium]|nr:histidinol-phosphate aminotransferase family protein [Alphaproteobacteria bacterium]
MQSPTLGPRPRPRPDIANPALTRPDWTKASMRDPSKLWLDKNENTDPALSAVVTKVMRSLPSEAYYTYPDSASLYAKLADILELFPEQLVLTAGSDGAIRAVFEAYISPGDVVLHTNPTFAMYGVYSCMYGAKAVTLDYRPSNNGPLLLSAEIIKAIAQERPKLVCLPNPDSPTGTFYPIRELELIMRAAQRVGALILIDEAYFPFHAESCIAWTRRFDHLVVARSTGKAWGLAGLRIGYAAASPEVAKILHKVRPMYEVNTVAVHAFQRMLDYAGDMMDSVKRLQAGKDLFLSEMERLGYRTLKGQGNFMHVAFGEQAAKVHAALEPLVYYRKDFNEPCLKGFSRFSATTPDLFKPIIQRISEVS